jgi:hypothetical protein
LDITKIISGEQKLSYLSIVAQFRGRESTQPEDKVFGLAALVDDFDDEMIDYGTSGACVFESFTIAMIKRSQSLDVLSHVVHPYGVPLDISCETGPLPSWVPHLEARISNALSSTVFRRHRIRYL